MLLSARRIGDELGGIAGAARAEQLGNGVACDFSAGVDDLSHAVAAAGAEIEVQPFTRREFFERELMGLGQVVDVNIVADAGAVRSWIVVAEYRDLLPLAKGDLQHNRNQVRFGRVIFA